MSVTVEFTYGVEDWDLSTLAGWQTFYVPQSQSICIADLTTLISEMNTECLYLTGYDTSGAEWTAGPPFDLTGTLQPKWYTFLAS